MSKAEIEAVVAAVNPVSDESVESLPLADAERELLDEVAREADGEVAAPAPSRARSGFGQRRRGYLALGGAVSAAAAVLLVLAGTGGGPAGGPGTAVGDSFARLVEASPPIVLDAPGWWVERADELFMKEGTTNFARTPTSPTSEIEAGHPVRGLLGTAEFQWDTETVRQRIHRLRNLKQLRKITTPEELSYYASHKVGRAPVLGTTAQLFRHRPPPERPYFEAVAVWGEDGQARFFRSFVLDMATFRRRLAALRRVDAETWAEVLQGKVVTRKNSISVRPAPPSAP